MSLTHRMGAAPSAHIPTCHKFWTLVFSKRKSKPETKALLKYSESESPEHFSSLHLLSGHDRPVSNLTNSSRTDVSPHFVNLNWKQNKIKSFCLVFSSGSHHPPKAPSNSSDMGQKFYHLRGECNNWTWVRVLCLLIFLPLYTFNISIMYWSKGCCKNKEGLSLLCCECFSIYQRKLDEYTRYSDKPILCNCPWNHFLSLLLPLPRLRTTFNLATFIV